MEVVQEGLGLLKAVFSIVIEQSDISKYSGLHKKGFIILTQMFSLLG